MNPGRSVEERDRAATTRGFTLIELLVVTAVLAVLAAVLLSRLPGGGQAVALQTGQSTLANALAAVRVRAMASGQPARLLVQVDPAGGASRYLRALALQAGDGANWATLAEVTLPPGIHLVPGNFSALPDGLFDPGETTAWRRSDGSGPLRSTALRSDQIVRVTVHGELAESWAAIQLAPAGTTVQSGDLVLALGREREAGTWEAGGSPVRLEQPASVRGLSLSAYGVATWVDAATGF